VPAGMKANGTLSDASLKLLHSVSQNKSHDEPEWRYWPGVAPVTAYLNIRWFTDTFSYWCKLWYVLIVVQMSKIVYFRPSCGVHVMTSYFNACDVTGANPNYKNFL